jgi:predicted nucleotide-binding protein
LGEKQAELGVAQRHSLGGKLVAISLKDYRYRANQLLSLDFQDATPRIAGFIEWLDSSPEPAAVLNELRQRNVQSLLDNASYQNPPKAKTPEDVAAIGLAIIDSAVKRNTEIFQIGYSIGVRAYSSKIQDTSDEILQRYIRPLLQYVEMRLFEHDPPQAKPASAETVNTREVFVVHGHDEASKQSLARFLEHLGLGPIILHEQSNRGRTIIEKFEDHAEVQFAVVILSADDVGRLATDADAELAFRARQNVVFEMGYFIGRIGRHRVLPLKVGPVELPSDYAGVAYTEMDPPGAWKATLVRELKAAGFPVDANKAFP